MATDIEYALMAGRIYQSTRSEINWFPDLLSLGWTEQVDKSQSLPSGFEATYFTKGSEIVISFAGTGSNVDWWANAGGFFGVTSDQLRQAADYYLQVKANTSATISFTGHSLGGGLASLMAVFFGQTATTFDQAPFRNSASVAVAAALKDYLLNQRGYSETALQVLTDFIGTAVNGGIPGEGNVRDFSVRGEILSAASGLRIGVPTSLTHGGAPDLTLTVALHSQALLTAFIQSDQTAPEKHSFRDATFKLPDVVQMIFNDKLFAHTTARSNTTDENFIERLVRHQNGVAGLTTGEAPIAADAMLTRFTADLWKLAQDGGLTLRDGNPTNADLNEVSKALTAFAMQKYYEETADSTGAGEKLFDDTGLTGGIRFDLAAVSSKIDTALKAGDRIKLADAKGFDLYFKNYLAQDGLFTPAESGLIQAMLPNLRDWYIQAGAGGMTATDTENRGAFMLGGSAADTLTGGDAADLLVGNGGDDILSGGKGSDVLIGGAGADTYKYADGDGLDTLFDDDGQGSIEIDGQTVTGGTQFGDDRVYRDSDGRLYAKLDDKRLAIAGNLFVENWQPGQLGIALSGPDAESAMPQTSRDINGDLAPQDFDAATAGVQGDVDELGNLKTEGAAPGRADLLFDSTGNDYIRGGGGDDIITAWRGGDDRIDGGAGNDAMRGDGGDDVLLGGDGSDVLSGGAGDDRLYADSQITVAQAIANGNSQNGTGQKADWLAGGNDDDILVGNAGNNVLSGGGGQDLLIGGAGDDYLLGDSDYLPAPADAIVFEEIGWSVNPYNWDWTVTPGANDTYTFQTAADSTDNPADSQADVIYAGSGNDVAWGGGGNDIIFGEAGNDKLIGNEGNDILLGGDITPLMKVGAGGTANDLWRRVAA